MQQIDIRSLYIESYFAFFFFQGSKVLLIPVNIPVSFVNCFIVSERIIIIINMIYLINTCNNKQTCRLVIFVCINRNRSYM